MHKPTLPLLLLLLTCFALLSFVSAQCGPGAGSCSDGNCCSRAGFCGNTELHCGAGCQVGYGACAGGSSSSAVDSSVTTAPYTPPASTSSETVSSTVSSILPSVVTTITTTTTTTTSSTASSSSSTKGTFQLQPTGSPSGATPSQDNGVRSTVALVVVFIAGMMMV